MEYLQDFNRYLSEHSGSAAGCVFPHNATSANIAGLRHPDLADLSFYPAFAADEVAKMRSFLDQRLAPVPGAQFADDFLASVIAPSKQLLKLVPQEITANPQFILLDEQQVAYEVVLRAVEHAKRSDAKEAVIITGGPGSGKSVIAMALLGELANRGYNVSHATGSKSFTTTLRQVDRFLDVFGTKVADKRALYGSKGSTVARDPTEENRVWGLFDMDEAGRAKFVSDPEIPEFLKEAGALGKPEAARLLGFYRA